MKQYWQVVGPFSMNFCSWKSICNEITDDYISIYNLPDMQTSSDHDWLHKKTQLACTGGILYVMEKWGAFNNNF